MKISWNRSHPERHTGSQAFHIGDIVQNKETRDAYKIVGWDSCEWYTDLEEYDSSHCEDCIWGRITMRLGLTKGSKTRISWGYMGSKHFCLGSPKVSWKRRKDVPKQGKPKIK